MRLECKLTATAKYADKNTIPIILETPDKIEGSRKKDIKYVKEMLEIK